jgi:hypothetical protein
MIAPGTTNGKAANVATTAIKLYRLKLRYFAQTHPGEVNSLQEVYHRFAARAIGIQSWLPARFLPPIDVRRSSVERQPNCH